MKVLGINCSPRKGGNTELLIKEVFKALENEGIKTEFFHLGGKKVIGAGVVAVRRAGAVHSFDSINHFFLVNEMIIPGSSYWNIGIGREKGEVLKDEEGMKTMRVLGENMAWLMKKIIVHKV